MAGPYDFTGQNIENTYQRVLQTPDGVTFYDGTGSLVTLPSANTASLLTTASATLNTLTFTKGDGSTFNVTVDTGSGGTTSPGGPNTSIQFNENGVFSGSSTFTFNSASNQVSLTGSMDLAGYIRFDPVTTNIDNSVSASYIYVSGSTNDLYFTQNGAGYNNVTRLRWLEGNLYTGLLHGGALTQVNSNTYQVASGSGIIVDLNASLANDPYPTVQFLNWSNLTKTIDALSASFDQQFIAISSSGQIHAQGTPYFNGDVDTYMPIGIVLHQNRSSINGVKTQPSLAYGWKQRSNVFISAFGPLKISGHAIATSSSRGLTVGSGTSFADGANYPTDPNNPSYVTDPGTNVSKIFRYRQSGSNFVYDTNGGIGYTTIDPTQYSLNGILTGVANNSWSIQRVFWYPNSVSKAIVVYYGNAVYSTESEAIANINIETFSEAPNTAANAIYLGAIIIKGDGTFIVDADYTIIPGGLFRGVGGGGGGGTTSPGGSNTQIQYNNNGAFGGVTNLTWNGTTLSATGSFTGSFTGSLFGTASYSTTASYALNGGVTQLLAGPNITLSPTNGLGQVTITSTGGGGVYGNTATGSYGSFYDTTTQTNPVANTIHSMSLNSTDISNGVSISGSISPYNTYIKTENAGVYDIQFSTQLDKTIAGNTSTVYIWLRKNGIDLTETNTIVELSQNGKGVAAWNWFVTAAANDYFQIMWSADRTDVQLTATTPAIGPAVPSIILTANRIDQFLSNTGSFTGSFTGELIGTASWALNAVTASYVQTAQTASYVLQAVSSSYASTASYVENAQTASYVLQAVSASYATLAQNANTASYVTLAQTASYVQNAQTASYVDLAQTASYIQGVNVDGDITGNASNITSYTINQNVGSGDQVTFAGVTSSLFGTSSWASKAITASYVVLAQTASYVLQAVSASYAITASHTINSSTASYVNNLNQAVTITGSLTLVNNTAGATLIDVRGTTGQLFSVTDSLSGSLFAVSDVSGLPILEAFSDSTVLIGNYQAPSLYTSILTSIVSGSTTVYSIPTASYKGAFYDYVLYSGVNSRAGSIMSVWNGTTASFNETTTTDIGDTNNLTFNVLISGSNAVLQTNTTSSWTLRTIIRSI